MTSVYETFRLNKHRTGGTSVETVEVYPSIFKEETKTEQKAAADDFHVHLFLKERLRKGIGSLHDDSPPRAL